MEVCHFWVRDVKEVIMKVTEHQFSGRGKEWRKIVRVGVVVGGDHGQGAFRVVLDLQDASVERKRKPKKRTRVQTSKKQKTKDDYRKALSASNAAESGEDSD